MKTVYGGFENAGAIDVDCKNFKRDINSFIGDYDANMFVQRLMDKKKYLTDFICEYHTGDDGSLQGVFWADAEAKRNYFTFGTSYLLMQLTDVIGTIWCLYRSQASIITT